ncbi:P-loop containing nucleoside triphosphate hydrolase protein [Trichoderma citrinoviride]|uniref:P-loop containing nucleoside triphosphate hydrolase protein n=1 Tax=Trichoderma citrinoviride TaxID=58853 RepID=A0A2T4BMM9_9HYPO|nr:P-loop containing nucleoside triphosphate hydrolase protein [Trichoderma citrinoviride]PTB70574.1 P-loop containing nucleoside triphosphate hydrolase protein [Trichoderma citrinoviride]
MLQTLVRRLFRPDAGTGVPKSLAFTNQLRNYAATAALSNKLKLRDYQLECIKSVLLSLKRGHKRVGISLATGSGKTVIFTQLIDRVHDRVKDGNQTLILAHRRELVEQAAKHCQLAYPDKKIEIEMGSLHASGTADITIASVQSITSRDRLDKYDPSRFKLVLVDEAHHIVAPGYLRTLKHFGLDEKRHNSPILVGVSATFSRFDGVKLGAAIDEIVYHKDYVDMISDKWLSDVIFTTVESHANLSKVKSGAFGDFQTGELSKVVNTDTINDITVRSWMAKAPDRKSTLVFCVDLAHVSGLTQKFREHGFDARYVTGDTPKVERSAILEAFKKREFPVLVNCGVFTEGTDIPNIDCIVLGRPTRSRNLLVQMIGRGMRLHPDKKNCHIIDMVSSLETGIVTTPTLFGLDPNELVEEASVEDMRKIKDQKAAEAEQQQGDSSGAGSGPSPAVTFTDYSSVLDLIADTSGERHIRTISQYAWVQVGPERFVLSAPSGSYIRIERLPVCPGSSGPTYRALEVRALPPGVAKSPYAAPREILKAATFNDAVHGADSYAASAFPHTFIHRHQSWRKLPPTQGQVDFINKLRGKSRPLTSAELTKGKAADMITKLKHGARGQFARMEAEQRRRDKTRYTLETRQDREHVRVGPLSA